MGRPPPPDEECPLPVGSEHPNHPDANQNSDRDFTPQLSASPVRRRCVDADPCIEVSARFSAAVDAWLDGCDDSAIGLARQAENYARLHELAPLPDEDEP